MNLEEILAKRGSMKPTTKITERVVYYRKESALAAMREAVEQERKFWEWASSRGWLWGENNNCFFGPCDYVGKYPVMPKKSRPELEAMYQEHLKNQTNDK